MIAMIATTATSTASTIRVIFTALPLGACENVARLIAEVDDERTGWLKLSSMAPPVRGPTARLVAVSCFGMATFGIVLTTLGASLQSVIARFDIDKTEAGALLSLLSFCVLA